LLAPDEVDRVEKSLARLREAIDGEKATLIQSGIDDLDAVTHDWAGLRMNRAIQSAISGKDIANVAESVKDARGVDAHVEEHAHSSRPYPERS
jgi:molecular chaperone HscA